MKKYILTKADYGSIAVVNSETHSISVTVGLQPSDTFIPEFSKTFVVEFKDSLTINQVETKCAKEVDDYMAKINA